MPATKPAETAPKIGAKPECAKAAAVSAAAETEAIVVTATYEVAVEARGNVTTTTTTTTTTTAPQVGMAIAGATAVCHATTTASTKNMLTRYRNCIYQRRILTRTAFAFYNKL